MPWSAAIPVVTGIVGNILGSGDRNDASAAYARAMQELDKLGLPPDLSKEIIYKQFESAGMLTPELEQTILLGDSAVAGIQEDPGTREAQVEALQLMQQSGRGLTPQDRAKFNQMRDEVQRDAEAKQAQILQEYQQRGMGSSGNALAARLASAQASANEASLQGDRIAATSAENALNALRQSGDMSSSLRRQDFDVANAKASAEDEFARFNAQNRANTQSRNIASINDARQHNLGNAQDILNKNTQLTNQERLRQVEAKRQYWQDKLSKAQAYGSAARMQGDAASARADRTANQWAAGGNAVAGLINAYSSGKTQKEDEDKTGTSYGGYKPINNI